MYIRIIKRPDGEAPEDVRDAWVGLLLPVLPHFSRPLDRRVLGVLSSPRWRFARRLKLWFGGGYQRRGYPVDTVAAVEILERVKPSAAAWWRKECPGLFNQGRCLFFSEDCCREETPEQ